MTNQADIVSIVAPKLAAQLDAQKAWRNENPVAAAKRDLQHAKDLYVEKNGRGDDAVCESEAAEKIGHDLYYFLAEQAKLSKQFCGATMHIDDAIEEMDDAFPQKIREIVYRAAWVEFEINK